MLSMNQLQNAVNRHADAVDKAHDSLSIQLVQLLFRKVQQLSLSYPTRHVKITSGHGSLCIEIEKRHGRGYWTRSYDDDDHCAVFDEVREISTRFQDHFNGYAAVQCDFTFYNGRHVK